MINAATFACLSTLEDTETFQLLVSSNKLDDSDGSSIDLTDVPPEYHNFSDIFNKACASTLAPHWPYDLKLDLEEGTSPPFGLILLWTKSETHSDISGDRNYTGGQVFQKSSTMELWKGFGVRGT